MHTQGKKGGGIPLNRICKLLLHFTFIESSNSEVEEGRPPVLLRKALDKARQCLLTSLGFQLLHSDHLFTQL